MDNKNFKCGKCNNSYKNMSSHRKEHKHKSLKQGNIVWTKVYIRKEDIRSNKDTPGLSTQASHKPTTNEPQEAFHTIEGTSDMLLGKETNQV